MPRAYGDKMWEDFNAARKYFFECKDANREQRKQYAESQKIARIQQADAQKAARIQHAKDIIVSLGAELKEEEEKLADFKTAIENITPGKKAAELRKHLENLITEGTQTVKKLQDKYKQAQKDTGATTESPNEDPVTNNSGIVPAE